ncbi:MAG: DUF444 family protein [bacterium]|nr:DUF444 family protein [bacterium]
MPIIVSENIGEPGSRDARRHREKQREDIKKRLPEIISKETIITGDRKGRARKIPIRSIETPEFKHRRGEDSPIGVGQGDAQPGDIIDHRPAPGDKSPGSAGEEPGVDYIETEITIAELVEMMMEDFGLPKLDEDKRHKIMVELGYKLAGVTRDGPWPLLDRMSTAKQAIKRFWGALYALGQESDKDQLLCYNALKQANGQLEAALKLLADPGFQATEQEIVPLPGLVISHDDLRFRDYKRDLKPQSRVVILFLMDVSGSMDDEKKYFARSIAFWLAEFLRQLYDHIEYRFIVHDVEARLVDEESFFKKGEGGGTYCSAAYEKAVDLIEGEYPTSSWDVYVFHFSDGDDARPSASVRGIRRCVEMGINMFGLAEIKPYSDHGSELRREIINNLPVQEEMAEGTDMTVISGSRGFPFLGATILDKEHIWSALKTFLKKDRWHNE